jgi:GTP-binding protein
MYDERLVQRPEVIALNKIDIPEAREQAESLREAFLGRQVFLLSGATSEGTRDLLQTLLRLLQETALPERAIAPDGELPVLRPRGRDRIDVEAQEDGSYAILGDLAEREALKLGAGGEDALDELQDRLRKAGLERYLKRSGARPGAVLHVGAGDGVRLEWHG